MSDLLILLMVGRVNYRFRVFPTRGESSCSIGEHGAVSSYLLGEKYRGDCSDNCGAVVLIICLFSVFQGRHVKTGQLAAIKVMDVTEVSKVGSHMFVSEILL